MTLAGSEVTTYMPTKTATLFHNDTSSFVRLILGPVGGGKTTICVWEMLLVSLRQEPDAVGVRKTRWVVIRNTFPELKSTTIKTWEHWFGGMCTTVYDTPIRSTIRQTLPDKTTLEMEVLFIALDDEQSLKKLRSLEVTGGYISEASEVPEAVVEMLAGRVGRYPAKDKHTGYGATWSGIIMESNPPAMRSWMYRRFEIDRPKDHRLFRQPAPLIYNPTTEEYDPNPDAENIDNLVGGYDYYYRQLRSAKPDYVKVFILGEYGLSYAGKPVFPTFSSTVHVAQQRLEPYRGSSIIVGMDFGLNPGAAFTQLTPMGQLIVLDELAPQDETLEDFVSRHVLPKLATRFKGYSVEIVGDPAGSQRNALAKLNTFQTLRSMGLASRPALTNDPIMRIGAVNYFLNRTGGLVVDPACVTIIEGFAGGYRFEKLRKGDFNTEYKEKPEKNKYSHIHDALQYAALHFYRGHQIGTKPRAPERKKFVYA
jgi:hypothetical protein